MNHARIGSMILALAIVGRTADAADLAVNVGVAEVAALPSSAHLGLYPFLGLSLAFVGETVNLIPSLAVECSPELGAWGFVAGFTFDFPVSTHLALDLTLSLTHDQEGMRWREATFYAGVGGGISVMLEEWSLSPSVTLYRGLNAPDWSWSPGLAVALTL